MIHEPGRRGLRTGPGRSRRLKRAPVEGLSDDERALLGDALRALRAERGKAWNAACDVAETAGKRRPPLRPYGIDEIKRLARRLGVGPTHWAE